MRALHVTGPLPTPSAPNTMAPAARQIASLRALGVDIDVLELEGAAKLKYPKSIPRLRRQAANADLVHAHYGYCGWLAETQRRRPVVVSLMGSDILGVPDADGRIRPVSKIPVRINRWLARRVSAVIVKSEEMARAVAPVPAHVIPNGVDTDRFRPVDRQRAQRALGWRADTRYVLFPGSPRNPRKCFPLAQAVVQAAQGAVDEPLELVPLSKVPADDVPQYMNGCEAMLMTSYVEGSPNVVKEAMACDLPVIGVAVGDVAELLDGVAGSSVHRRDEGQLADALVSSLASDGPNGGRDAIERRGLDLDSVARRIVSVYDEVLA